MKAAQVIIDVPLMQTDHPFTYLIPDNLQGLIQAGMRVHVPFGQGNRLVQGIVVELSESNDDENLKEIREVLDLEPVLNKEQLQLADHMRKTVFSYKITCLKAMLPNLLNSNYDKIVMPLDQETKDTFFAGKENLKFSTLTEDQQVIILKLKKEDKVSFEYEAKSRENKKYETFIQLEDIEKLRDFEIPTRAKKKQEFKEFLLGNPGKKQVKEVRKNFSKSIIDFFVENDLVKLEHVELRRAQEHFDKIKSDKPLVLNEGQEKAYQAVINGTSGKPFLLEGITGSGKTEVYLQIIAHTLNEGKTAIMLVPEISLTPQITNRFIARFGDQVAILHSRLSDGEKYDEWRKIESGQAKVVVGARSAIFAPLENIGTIIIDEEHESSYKQDSNPRYHARDIALFRADWHKAKLIMGSATPSLESRARADRGVYEFLELKERANPLARVPKVDIIDFRKNMNEKSANFTMQLLEKIQEKLDKNEQIVLMLNRRGYSSFIMCRDCGYVEECPNCDISLTLHMDTKTLDCHYCGFQEAIPSRCPNCQSKKFRYYGSGTQKIEEELNNLFPRARILRMDVDTTKKKGAHEQILDKFGNHEADILLGTQMIAKGLDFPNVTLVGVINADTALNLPDFRSSERTFQLLTQVAGRAGRADKEGEVIIQTFNPEHYAIKLAEHHDYEAFYKQEMQYRRTLAYPPYFYTVQIVVSHKNEEEAIKKSYEIMSLLASKVTDKAKILGPTAKPIARTHNMYHYQILIKYRFEEELQIALNQVLEMTQDKNNKGLRIIIDSEPQNFI
ncbi:primosomal protein N' [Floricoccus penangensis]|uniref:Replication restart protein PriA n=1 Tax=Floricoccus penangensis TaxID=1859475 RepID=A0A9Q5JFD2_9LACT|nr:primosomal protein N' [Floricoccus penangensis]OFI46222.1 primosomal protein N' [Floricoccus penangensis]